MEWLVMTTLRVLMLAMVFRIGFWFGKLAHEVDAARRGDE